MKAILTVLTGLVLIIIFTITLNSCDENSGYTSVDCDKCYQEEPDSADIYVKLTINEENPRVPIVIYRGDIDNNDIEYIDTTYGKDYYLYVPVDKYYSVKAQYKAGSKTIIAVDGAKIKTKLITDECDEDCYIIIGGNMDAELKYNK